MRINKNFNFLTCKDPHELNNILNDSTNLVGNSQSQIKKVSDSIKQIVKKYPESLNIKPQAIL